MRKLIFPLLLLFYCTPTHATTCGYTTVGSSSGGGSFYNYAGASCTPGVNSTVTDCQVHVHNSGDGVVCVVLDSNGSSGTPGTTLCYSATTSTPTSNVWVVVSISGCPTLTAGHKYYIAALMNSANHDFDTGLGSDTYSHQESSFTITSWITNQTLSGYQFSQYLDIAAAASPLARKRFAIMDALPINPSGATFALRSTGAGTDQTGTYITSIATASFNAVTGDVVVVGMRNSFATHTFNAPTVTGGTGTCSVITASDSGPLAVDPHIGIARCNISAGNASTVVTCNFGSSVPYDSCVAMDFSGPTGSTDTGEYSSGQTTGTSASLGTNLFTTGHSPAIAVACWTYNGDNATFTAGSIAGSTATLGATSGNNSTGSTNDTGCEYYFLSGTVASQQATGNLNTSQTNITEAFGVVY